MPRYSYGGVSTQTKRGLLESGAMQPSDFTGEQPTIPLSQIGKDPTRQVNPGEYQSIQRQQKALEEASMRRAQRIKNLGKYGYKKKRGVYGDT
jgi:hypothetical protein